MNRTLVRQALPLLLLLLGGAMGGCATGAAGGSPGGDPDRISETEIQSARQDGVANVAELIERLRPRWLQAARIQSFNTPTGIIVYDGESLLGDPEVLSTLPLENIREVRWLTPAQAGTLPGAGGMHVQGAIVIVRR